MFPAGQVPGGRCPLTVSTSTSAISNGGDGCCSISFLSCDLLSNIQSPALGRARSCVVLLSSEARLNALPLSFQLCSHPTTSRAAPHSQQAYKFCTSGRLVKPSAARHSRPDHGGYEETGFKRPAARLGSEMEFSQVDQNQGVVGPGKFHADWVPDSGAGGGNGYAGGNGDGGNGRNDDKLRWHDRDDDSSQPHHPSFNIPVIAALTEGWHLRTAADPQFNFKILTEQIVGGSACLIGDMSSRPNFGLSELDFVFSTMLVGAIINVLVMYMLAPTSLAGSAASASLPGPFSSCPASNMFEAGQYTILERAGTFVYKGMCFGAASFVGGIVGTAISNLLLGIRKKVQKDLKLENPPPPPLLSAATWALHLGLSGNLRYQSLTAFDLMMAKKLSPSAFRALVFFTHALNNVFGASTFVMLAKATGSQKAGESPSKKERPGMFAELSPGSENHPSAAM